MTSRGLLNFVSQYTKKGSVSVARAGVISFLTSVYGEQRKVEEGKFTKKEQIALYNELSIQYLEDPNRDRLYDATVYATSLSKSPPMTARARVSAVRSFLAFNNIEFSDKRWGQVQGKMPKGNARTVEQEIDVVTVRLVLEHADIKMKSLVCFLTSTGCRLNEALGLHIEDIQFDGDKIAKVTIRGELTKTGVPRECYCSTESVRYLKEWLRIRPTYMKSAAAKANGLKASRPAADDDHRLFPFTDHTAIMAWNNIAEKAGYGAEDRSTGRRTLHLHMMRKLFRSQLALKVPVDVVESLMGHGGYLTGEYRRFTKKQVKELYEKGSSVLHIFGDADISQVREQLETTTRDLEETKKGQQQTTTAQSMLVIENQELKKQLSFMEERIKEIERIQELTAIAEENPLFKIAYKAAMAATKAQKQ